MLLCGLCECVNVCVLLFFVCFVVRHYPRHYGTSSSTVSRDNRASIFLFSHICATRLRAVGLACLQFARSPLHSSAEEQSGLLPPYLLRAQ